MVVVVSSASQCGGCDGCVDCGVGAAGGWAWWGCITADTLERQELSAVGRVDGRSMGLIEAIEAL